MSVTVPAYVPLQFLEGLRNHWKPDRIEKLLTSLPPQLPRHILTDEFVRAAEDLLNYTDKWNIALHDNPTIPKVPEGLAIINGHCHASGFGLDIIDTGIGPELVPFAAKRNYNAWPFPYDDLNAYNHKMGIRHGSVIVGQTVYRNDNRYLVHALRQANGRAMDVASVAIDTPEEEIRALYKEGVRGFRFTGVPRLMDKDDPFDIDKVSAFAERVASYGLEGVNMNLYLESADLVKYEEKIKAMKLPVFLDHFAIPDVFDFADKGPESESYKALVRILEANPKNMAKGFGPERIMMAAITPKLSPARRGALLYGDFQLDHTSAQSALARDEELSPKIRGELAVNAGIWNRYVLPVARRIVEQFPSQVIFGTDAQHPNTTVAVNDGKLVDFALRVVEKPEHRLRVFSENARAAYPGHRFGPDSNFQYGGPDRSIEDGPSAPAIQ